MEKRLRCATGIEGLDNILNGGIPIGNSVLVAGACGSGKTTLSMEFLVNGAKLGDTCMFISVTEPVSKLVENLKSFNFFDPKLIAERKLNLFDLGSIYERLGIEKKGYTISNVEPIVNAIEDITKKLNAKRLVIDSITAVCHQLENRTRIRELIFNLGRVLSALKCTTLMTSEVQPTGSWGGLPGVMYSVYGIEEAIADGIILLGTIERKGYMLRTLHVVKMRGTTHSLAKYILDLTPNGVVLIPLLKWGAESG
ncbi:MAG: ATPase domain-containing protein [Candidatus Thermoplasmatota archaeon]|nr:ATPase domain-containing protein [Candidatus Thermoplasmatota archaeon]MDI6855826.1 ATPase domain-containing protein [Candidatus Thermoplasmatota archaeon]